MGIDAADLQGGETLPKRAPRKRDPFLHWWKIAGVTEVIKKPKNPLALQRLARAAFEAGYAEGLTAVERDDDT